jgi:hypothetical protein
MKNVLLAPGKYFTKSGDSLACVITVDPTLLANQFVFTYLTSKIFMRKSQNNHATILMSCHTRESRGIRTLGHV